ncbi:hypothetical protein C9374_014473 [Naegleria lovaniensis]|uniref:Uncharacterized protein n=1 Tax=Naegleria lovaniensis TaxID=51637 RepID=A0AA88GZ56_NAELO|nr:uncharacterized protein C9374_014473 [Naegleria lovaniensis]KAG2389073.1 hypothetical protein C9374_014473 [Naegleria lovaniensis]
MKVSNNPSLGHNAVNSTACYKCLEDYDEENESTCYCTHCHWYLCQQHTEQHRKHKSFKSHSEQVVELTNCHDCHLLEEIEEKERESTGKMLKEIMNKVEKWELAFHASDENIFNGFQQIKARREECETQIMQLVERLKRKIDERAQSLLEQVYEIERRNGNSLCSIQTMKDKVKQRIHGWNVNETCIYDLVQKRLSEWDDIENCCEKLVNSTPSCIDMLYDFTIENLDSSCMRMEEILDQDFGQVLEGAIDLQSCRLDPQDMKQLQDTEWKTNQCLNFVVRVLNARGIGLEQRENAFNIHVRDDNGEIIHNPFASHVSVRNEGHGTYRIQFPVPQLERPCKVGKEVVYLHVKLLQNDLPGSPIPITITNKQSLQFIGFVTWSQHSQTQTLEQQDALMNEAVRKQFGNEAYALSAKEFSTELDIENLPSHNTSGFYLTFTSPENSGNLNANSMSGFALRGVSPGYSLKLPGTFNHSSLTNSVRACIAVRKH